MIIKYIYILKFSSNSIRSFVYSMLILCCTLNNVEHERYFWLLFLSLQYFSSFFHFFSHYSKLDFTLKSQVYQCESLQKAIKQLDRQMFGKTNTIGCEMQVCSIICVYWDSTEGLSSLQKKKTEGLSYQYF